MTVFGVDKFPRMVDYVIPSGVRIADGDRVRLGAHLAEGTTVMHEGFVNYNAGTLGPSMVEGRISAGVVVGADSDIGGGASIMGTLSGGGTQVISIGSGCLLGANAGIGISLGDGCVVEAGCYVTAGSRVTLPDGSVVKAARALRPRRAAVPPQQRQRRARGTPPRRQLGRPQRRAPRQLTSRGGRQRPSQAVRQGQSGHSDADQEDAVAGMQHKILLDESQLPTQWYNVVPDLPSAPPPPLHPGTLQPVGPDDLAPLFPMDLIPQEVTDARFVDIPGEVLDVYKLWRPSPLYRAHRLEKALGTPARIYYKYEGVSPAGSHKPNTACRRPTTTRRPASGS